MSKPVLITGPATGTQGQDIEICYDFTHPDAQSPATIHLQWTPETVEGQDQLVLTAQDPCGTVSLPHDSMALLCVDDSGTSADKAVAIAPSS